MVVAVLTHCNTLDNYGEILQGFALQHFLKDRGHNAYIVRYRPSYHTPKKENLWVSFLCKLKYLLNLPSYLKARKRAISENELIKINAINNPSRRFDDFRAKYIKMGQHLYTSIDELRANPPQADIYICGSDQVWHDDLTQPNVAGWYLQFGKKSIKRLSYAPSIGRSIDSDEEILFRQYLSSFDALSLREKTAYEYCQDLGFKNVKLVCDPTLLLSAAYYKELFEDVVKKKRKPYVFFYTLNIQEKEEIMWESISPIINCKKWDVKSVGSSGYYQAKNIIPDTTNILATVEEWFRLIDGSEMVISTSYHAVVFSIILHKPFVSIPLVGRYEKANDRITNLLGELGLSSRICYDSNNLKSIIEDQIDWKPVDAKVEILKQNSITFLSENGL